MIEICYDQDSLFKPVLYAPYFLVASNMAIQFSGLTAGCNELEEHRMYPPPAAASSMACLTGQGN